jgi:3-hydroxymyristoyl/3-hydroxydecanoyl-(acyl carrier protein) dehydratase
MWHSLDIVETLDSGEWRAEARVPKDSSWFVGHFPGDPILPGIAQMGMAFETVSRVLGEGIRVSRFNRIKFKKIIRPGDCLEIVIQAKKDVPGLYAFQIMTGGEIACSGTMAIEQCHNHGQSRE